METGISLLGIIGIVAIIVFLQKYHEKRGEEGSNLDSDLYPYYSNVLDILQGFDTEFAKTIREGAREQLKVDLKSYTAHSGDGTASERYYDDLINCKSHGKHLLWATLYVRFQLDHVGNSDWAGMKKNEEPLKNFLKERLDREIETFLSNREHYPASFFVVFPIDWVIERIESEE